LRFVDLQALDTGVQTRFFSHGAGHIENTAALAAHEMMVPFTGRFVDGPSGTRVGHHDQTVGYQVVQHVEHGCPGKRRSPFAEYAQDFVRTVVSTHLGEQ
jgi:hypothetical protein